MTADEDLAAEDWERTAREYAAAARRLARMRPPMWRSAYHEAGLALECALKACIMRLHGLNHWPTRSRRPEFYTHDPDILLRLAGLEVAMPAEVDSETAIGLAWSVAKDFSINRRYPDGRAFPEKLAKGMEAAINARGLLEWLLTHRR